MKSFIFTLTIAIGLSVIGKQVSRDLDENEKNSQTNKLSVLQRVGGFVIDYKAARGNYLFVNCQKTVDITPVKEIAKGMKADYSWNIDFIEGTADVASIKQAISEKTRLGALAATMLIDCDDLPTMVVVPEDNLAVINIRKLSVDKPRAILLENRVVREVMRGFAMSLGVGYTTFDAGVTQPISSAADLDRFSSNFLPADSVNAALLNGVKIGFKPYRRTTYKRACLEGWAPAPTNAIQQAIWDKVKAEQAQVPTKPIKITPDMKPKGK